MKPEIASLHERMAKGGNWKTFRDEIAALHKEASTEEEYITLLKAHRNLVAVGEYAYDQETWSKLLPIARSEYLFFLNKESMEDDLVNPLLLEKVTRREVEAGRLNPDDEFRKLAIAAAKVLGDTGPLNTHACRHGDSFFLGALLTGGISYAIPQTSLAILIASALVVGWIINELERFRIKKEVARRRMIRK
jgi:hypothetical protein